MVADRFNSFILNLVLVQVVLIQGELWQKLNDFFRISFIKFYTGRCFSIEKILF